ncbi:S41 family peptidase [Qipengyuania vesicularis]|uniref:S41 family peptidase n=1 Tax=Qipengyuania vesicularis TaxID=2867232 RepID=UPI001C866FEA|nr:S41 family peptidase [Qipengyuania vesicularis]MBX7528569.1 peptidase S41 [Qipengyuania vesicularis]
MDLGRTLLSATLAVSLAACGGGDGSTRTSTGGGTGGGGGGGSASCTLSDRQDWALAALQEWYLFPDLLDTSVNKASHSSLQSYLDALVAPARAQGKDRFFTYITSIQEETDLINNGSNAGFGIRLSYDTVADRVFILEAFENGPAFPAGFDRGTEILQINGQSVSTLMANGGPAAVSNALGPSDPGVTRSFVIQDTAGVQRTVNVTKAEYPLDPVSDRYGVKVLDDGAGGQVGYINLRTFIVQGAGPQLRTAFTQFRSQGITNIILDFRYNGGGLVSVAELLGDLMAEGLEGQVFSRTELRPSKSSENSTELFSNQAEQIDVMKLAVIGSDGTASASELVTNSMIPYLGDNIALIGANTFGKPVGQFAFDRSACDDRLRAVAFKTVNRDGQGEYFNGLADVMPNTCRADDDYTKQLGDPDEASVAAALDFIAGRTCTPISQTKDGTVQAERRGQRLLQPDFPNAVQRENPGVY